MVNIWYSASILHLSERFLLFLRCEGVPGKAVKEHVGAKPNHEYTLTLSGQKKRRSDNKWTKMSYMSQKHMLYHAPWVEKHCQRRKVLRWTTLERDTERSWQLGSDRRWYYQPLEDRGHSGPRLLCWSSGFVAPQKEPTSTYKCSRHHHIWGIQIPVIIWPFVWNRWSINIARIANAASCHSHCRRLPLCINEVSKGEILNQITRMRNSSSPLRHKNTAHFPSNCISPKLLTIFPNI